MEKKSEKKNLTTELLFVFRLLFGRISAVKKESEKKVKKMSDKVQVLENE